jgi:uncharacterized protein (TIGR02246 family)
MKRTHILGATLLTLGIAACEKAATVKADPAAVQNSIKADEKKWNDDFKAKNLEALLSHYADDATFVTSGGAATGSTAIRQSYSTALADHYFTVSFASDKIDVAASGDLAYSRGHFSEKYQDPKSKQIVSDSGTFVTVYKKQADGSWKAVEDFAVADPATRKESSAVVVPPKMISM